MSGPALKTREMPTILNGILVLLQFGILVWTSLAWGADISAVFHPHASVRGEEVFFRDLARLTGPDSALKNDLGGIFITKAPPPGQDTTIRQAYLEFRLRSSGLPLDQIDLNLPEQTVVSRESQGVDEKWIRRIFTAYLQETEPYKSGQWELISLRTGSLPTLPAGELTYKIMPKPSSNPSYLNAALYLLVDGKEAGRIRVAGRINLFVQTVIAAQRMDRGHRIGPDDVKPARISLARTSRPGLTDPREAIGLTTRRMIQPGQPILAEDLIKAAVVEKGDLVTIVAHSGTLRVSTTGQAKDDGAVGDNIPVLNLSSKKMITAEVIGPDTVQVIF